MIKAMISSKYATVIAEVVLLTVLNLATFSILVRLTDVKIIGLWVLINSLLGFSRMADFWSAGLVTFVAENLAQKKTEAAARLVSTAVLTAMFGFLAVVLVLGAALYSFANHIPGIQNAGLVQNILPLMCITFWMIAVATTYHIGFLGFNRPGFKFVQNSGGAALLLVVSLVLVPHFGLWGILWAQFAQAFAMLVFGFFSFHFVVSPHLKRPWWSQQDFKKLTGFGVKASSVGFLQIATEPLIKLLISKFGGLDAVTLMELATRMIVAVRGVIISTGQLLVPAFARSSIEGPEKLRELYAETQGVFILVTVPVLACLLSVSPFLEHIMLGQRSTLFLPMLWLLSAGWAVNILTAPAFFLLTGLRRLRPIFWNRLLMLLVVLVLGEVGGMLAGVLGVVCGVAVGLICSGAIVQKAAQEFATQKLQLGFVMRCLAPLFVAGVSVVFSLLLEQRGEGVAAVAVTCFMGLIGTVAASFAALPLGNLVNALLKNKVL
jgi:O-antigen/teichoic acid export membrane protein